MRSLLVSVIIAAVLACSPADAGLLRLDFSGQVVSNFFDDGTVYNDPFSGYFLFDTSVPDVRPEPNNARYADAIIAGGMSLNGVDYTFTPSFGAGVIVVNDSDVFGDIFATLALFESEDGDVIDFGIQLADMTASLFDSDAFPTAFSLGDFGGYVPDDYNSTLTYFFGLDSGFDVLGTLNSAELYAITEVPEPGTLLIIATGLILLAAHRKRATSHRNGAD